MKISPSHWTAVTPILRLILVQQKFLFVNLYIILHLMNMKLLINYNFLKRRTDSSIMKFLKLHYKIIDSMFHGNVIYPSEGSFEVHTIKKKSTDVPDCCGFKINIGNNNDTLTSADKLGLLKKEDIMCLKSWTIIKGKTSGLFKIKGKLCDKKNSITGKIHDAGFIKKTIKKDLIQTTNGKYHLITPPAEPKDELNKRFYTFWMKAGGFPQKFNKL